MRITQRQLRRIIREEYLRSAQMRPGRIISESRAMMLAEQALDESFFGNIAAMFAGKAKGAKSVAGKAAGAVGRAAGAVGDAAAGAVGSAKDKASQAVGAAFQKAAGAVGQVAQQAKSVSSAAQKAFKEYQNEEIMATYEAAKESLESTLKSVMQKEMANAIQQLVKYGSKIDDPAKKIDEEKAKAMVQLIASQVMSEFIGGEK